MTKLRYFYDFDETSEGGRELLGGKGIGLAEMTALGVPVPAGFTITTDACRAYMESGKELPDGPDTEDGTRRPGGGGEGRTSPRRPRRSAALLRTLRGGLLDAGDDGHDP